jgi:thioredoxin 1
MKKAFVKKLITIVLLFVAVVAVVELQKFMKNRTAECVDGQCKIPTDHGLVINPFPLEMAPAQPIEQARPQLIDFGAGKCATCKMMNVVLEELSAEHGDQINIRFVDVWENEEASEAHSIRIIPTQVFLDADGNELFRHEGFISKEDILKKWVELGIHLKGGERL